MRTRSFRSSRRHPSLIGHRSAAPAAIEVVWTSGGIDKLEAYRRLSVKEVWFWKDGTLHVYVHDGDAYTRQDRSAVLPDLDLRLLCSLLEQPTVTQAIKALRAALAR